MFERVIEYETIKYMGGGSLLTFFEMEYLINRGKLKVSRLDFIDIVKKCLEYGLLKLDVPSHRPFMQTRPCPRFSLTEKGGQALEYYKYCRYHDDGPSLYKLRPEESKNITMSPTDRDPREYYDKKTGKWRLDLNRV